MATDATLVETHDTPGHDTLVPDPLVQKSLASPPCRSGAGTGIELIKLGWPRRLGLGRKFRSRIALENFKRGMARRAIEHGGQSA